jgi:putative ubiquitin-RnfH superfamily antitoxin RatB of RatAB toxin-antitoxin module
MAKPVDSPTLTVEVCLVDDTGVRLTRLQVPVGTTVAGALAACGMASPGPGGAAGQAGGDAGEAAAGDAGADAGEAVAARAAGPLAVALQGRRVAPQRVLCDGDRIELLPPLRVDPKLARQRRVDKRRRDAGDDRWQRG